MVIGVDLGDGAVGNVDTVAGRTAVYQIPHGEAVAPFDDVKDFDGGAEKSVGVVTDEIEIRFAPLTSP